MEKISENPITIFAQAIKKMTRNAMQGKKFDSEELFDWSPFNLDNLAGCFFGIEKEKFLTDKVIKSFLEEIEDEDFALRRWFPEGFRLTLCVLPCDMNGLILPPDMLDDTTNDQFPYFQLFFSNPTDHSGMAITPGQIKQAPYMKLIPEEIRNQCSFTIEYRSGKNRKNGESDNEYLCRMLKDRYDRLRKIIMEKI